MSKIIAVCKSKQKGTSKKPMTEGYLEPNYGLADDAHADCSSHRQVSLMAIESINKMRELGLDVGPGAFAENLTTEGIELFSLPIGTKVDVGGEVILEITQIGKECHTKCAIYHQIGQCIMPQEGVFTRVIRGGLVKAGDEIRIEKEG
ncbi:MAG: MOSC domain-containing protein [Dehalococcoidales bacterium]|nr:MOSC domain-containing protein [Dehalococcoidales bacterium]